MFVKEQKMLGSLLILTPTTFFGALGEDAHEFLVAYEDRIHNLGLVDSHSMD